MRNTIRKTVGSAAAIAVAVAGVPAVARGEKAPTSTEVNQTLQQNYDQLVDSAKRFGRRNAVSPTAIGSVAVTEQNITFGGAGGVGTYTRIQSDAYYPPTRMLSETVIKVSTPAAQKGNSTSLPNSLFQITVYQGENNLADAPRTPAGFSRAIDRAAAKSNLNEYNFNLGVLPQDNSWQLTAHFAGEPTTEVFSTATAGPLSSPETSVSQNFGIVRQFIKQAKQVLNAAEHHRVLPEGTPADPLP